MGKAKKTKAEGHADQLARLTAEVEALRRELRRTQRLATVGTMTAMVAHEFNNILTPIINYAQLAQTNPKMVEKAIARASEGGLRATEICKAILDITRDQPPDPTEENMSDLVREALAAMGRDPSKDGIDMVVDIPEDLTLTTRRLELQQVVLNLVVNARTAVLARPTPRRIQLRAKTSRKHIIFYVSDNGVGIAPENMKKVFEPFFTTNDGTESERHGHGLGLAICREIIDALNGAITLTSTPGEGTTFTIRLAA